MTKRAKILACYGHVDVKSTAKMVGCSKNHVYVILRAEGLTPNRAYSKRRKPKKMNEHYDIWDALYWAAVIILFIQFLRLIYTA